MRTAIRILDDMMRIEGVTCTPKNCSLRVYYVIRIPRPRLTSLPFPLCNLSISNLLRELTPMSTTCL